MRPVRSARSVRSVRFTRPGRTPRPVAFLRIPATLACAAVAAASSCEVGANSTAPAAAADSARLATAAAALEQAASAGALHGAASVLVPGAAPRRTAGGRLREPDGEPVTADSRFRLASLTKLVVQVAVLRLVERGDLDLDQTLASARPGFEAPWAERVTLRQLLAFRSGLPRELRGDPLASGVQLDADGRGAPCVDGWTAVGPELEPDTRTEYSNLGYLHLGAVIERATDRPLEAALRELVLAPAGMDGVGLCTCTPGADAPPGHAVGHAPGPDGAAEPVAPFDVAPRWSAGGLHGSVVDLEHLARGLLDGELLGEAATDELFTQFGRPGVDPARLEARGHVPGFANALTVSREPPFAVVALQNLAPADARAALAPFEAAVAELGDGAAGAHDEDVVAHLRGMTDDGWTLVASFEAVPPRPFLPRVRAYLESFDGDRADVAAALRALHGVELDDDDEEFLEMIAGTSAYEKAIHDRFGPFRLAAWRPGRDDELELYLLGPEKRGVRYRFGPSARADDLVGTKAHATMGFRPPPDLLPDGAVPR